MNPNSFAARRLAKQANSPKPSLPFREFAMMEGRYKSLLQSRPEEAEELLKQAQEVVDFRWRMYEQLAGLE